MPTVEVSVDTVKNQEVKFTSQVQSFYQETAGFLPQRGEPAVDGFTCCKSNRQNLEVQGLLYRSLPRGTEQDKVQSDLL